MVWGRLSDHIGRKPCVLLGLLGSALSILGFGFSETFESALMFRVLAGCLNGNVGVLRTMLSETIREKRHQSRAFLIMPMCFNVGIILGPALGGVLADPASSWPEVFGNWEWCHRHRWALPNVVSAMFLMGSFIAGLMFLDEVHIPSTIRMIGAERELMDTRRWKARSIAASVATYNPSYRVNSIVYAGIKQMRPRPSSPSQPHHRRRPHRAKS